LAVVEADQETFPMAIMAAQLVAQVAAAQLALRCLPDWDIAAAEATAAPEIQEQVEAVALEELVLEATLTFAVAAAQEHISISAAQ
jgi:hypothetical protein